VLSAGYATAGVDFLADDPVPVLAAHAKPKHRITGTFYIKKYSAVLKDSVSLSGGKIRRDKPGFKKDISPVQNHP